MLWTFKKGIRFVLGINEHILTNMVVVQHTKKANPQIRTFWFLPTHVPNTKNQKSLFFRPRSERPTIKRMNRILKNEIN